MKRIKKTLCLMLVLALALGMVPAMSGTTAVALDFEDADDIKNIDSASVLNALGIMVGDSVGFRPNDTINRAEAATIITRMLIGAEFAKIYEESTASSHFTDVSSSQWWSGVIMFAYERGIIHGTNVSGTRFSPRGTLTIPQFAIMLMRALGKATTNDYLDNNWIADALTDAMKLGLLEGVTAEKLTDDATRDIAAQMAFNALFFDPDGGTVVPGSKIETHFVITSLGSGFDWTDAIYNGSYGVADFIGAILTNQNQLSAKLTQVFASGAPLLGTDFTLAPINVTVDDSKTLDNSSLAATIHKMSTTSGEDAFYRPVLNYYIGNPSTTNPVYTKVATPVNSWTEPVNGSTIRTAFGITDASATITTYVNGNSTSTTTTVAATGNDAGRVAVTGNGVSTELYVVNNVRRIVVVDTYVGVVTNVTGQGTTRAIVVSNLTGKAIGEYRTSLFARDDVVIFQYSEKTGISTSPTLDTNSVFNIQKVEPLTNLAITATTGSVATGQATNKNGTFTADGKTYRLNQLSNIQTTALNAHADNKFDIFLDTHGYAVLTRPTAAATLSNLLYVRELGLGQSSFGGTVVMARVVLDDGTTSDVNTNMRQVAGGTAINIGSNTVYSSLSAAQAAFTANPIAFYIVNDGTYALTIATGSSVHDGINYDQVRANSDAGLGSITRNNPNLTGFGTNTRADNDTRFVIGTPATGFTQYIGISGSGAVPSITGATGAVLRATGSPSNRAVAVFVVGSTAADGSDPGVVFLVGAGVDTTPWVPERGGSFRAYHAVVEGTQRRLETTNSVVLSPNQFVLAASTNINPATELVTGFGGGAAPRNISELATIAEVYTYNGTLSLSAGFIDGTSDAATSALGYAVAADATVWRVAANGAITAGSLADFDANAPADQDPVGRHVAVSRTGGVITTIYYFRYDFDVITSLTALTGGPTVASLIDSYNFSGAGAFVMPTVPDGDYTVTSNARTGGTAGDNTENVILTGETLIITIFLTANSGKTFGSAFTAADAKALIGSTMAAYGKLSTAVSARSAGDTVVTITLTFTATAT